MAVKRIVKEYIDNSVKPLKTNGHMKLDDLARSYIRNKLRREYDVNSFKTNLNTVTDNILDEFLRYINDEASGFLINELTYEDGLVKGSEVRNAVQEFIDFNLRENDINEYDFDYMSENLDEARDLHTWSVTYTGKGNKAKTHMVDAPDAYEANRKARRELGISYSDIDDVTMVENKEVVNEEDYGYGYTTNGEPIDESIVDELCRIADEILENSVLAEEDPYVTIDEDEGFKYWCDGSSYVLEEFAIAFRLEDLSSKWIESHNMFDFSTSEYWDTTDEYEIGTLIYVKNGEITDIVWTNGPDLPDYHAQINYDALGSWIKQLAAPVAMDIYNRTTNI